MTFGVAKHVIQNLCRMDAVLVVEMALQEFYKINGRNLVYCDIGIIGINILPKCEGKILKNALHLEWMLVRHHLQRQSTRIRWQGNIWIRHQRDVTVSNLHRDTKIFQPITDRHRPHLPAIDMCRLHYRALKAFISVVVVCRQHILRVIKGFRK